METTLLEIKNLDFFYGDSQALKGVNMDIYKNKVTAIMGPSGCGKTTLIRIINRMHEITPNATAKGEILLDGEDIFKMKPLLLRQRIGMVFQKPNPFPTFSIFDNVIAGYKLNGIKKSKSEFQDIVEESLHQSALWDEVKDNLHKKGTFLSGGQQQRLCLARTLAMKPDILLLDEPTSALDPISTTKIEELILELKDNYTIMIVTHNLQQAARISNYTAFFYLGELIEYDRTKTIFTKPKNQQTEEYVTGRFG